VIIDIHVHLAGNNPANGNHFNPEIFRGLALKSFLRVLKIDRAAMAEPRGEELARERLLAMLNESVVDRAVLFAFDSIHREDGAPEREKCGMITSNSYIAKVCRENPKCLFGASVHPFRKDALEALEEAAASGACLVKWLPSGQCIVPDHPKCHKFYDKLAELKLPLLSHCGEEHVFRCAGSSMLNDPERLTPALERGVTVIAAHCGVRILPFDLSFHDKWRAMALKCPNFYGDISAFGLPFRNATLKDLLRHPELLEKLVYGSDFPLETVTPVFLFSLGLRKTIEISRVKNLFDKAYLTLKHCGLPDAVFTRASKLLRLPR
jgi:predicted TIM-barrel fold metal-dependent hydrolase